MLLSITGQLSIFKLPAAALSRFPRRRALAGAGRRHIAARRPLHEVPSFSNGPTQAA